MYRAINVVTDSCIRTPAVYDNFMESLLLPSVLSFDLLTLFDPLSLFCQLIYIHAFVYLFIYVLSAIFILFFRGGYPN